jgi:hypothetical protein
VHLAWAPWRRLGGGRAQSIVGRARVRTNCELRASRLRFGPWAYTICARSVHPKAAEAPGRGTRLMRTGTLGRARLVVIDRFPDHAAGENRVPPLTCTDVSGGRAGLARLETRMNGWRRAAPPANSGIPAALGGAGGSAVVRARTRPSLAPLSEGAWGASGTCAAHLLKLGAGPCSGNPEKCGDRKGDRRDRRGRPGCEMMDRYACGSARLVCPVPTLGDLEDECGG